METVLRVGFIYVFILVTLRVMGKRELSQLSPMELVMLLLIPELVSQALIREDFSMTNAVIAVTTLTSLVFVTSALVYRFKRFGEIVEGKASLLVEKGEPLVETMDRERIPIEELAAEIRKAGIERLEDVKWAVLESGGKIAVIGYDQDDVHPRGRRNASSEAHERGVPERHLLETGASICLPSVLSWPSSQLATCVVRSIGGAMPPACVSGSAGASLRPGAARRRVRGPDLPLAAGSPP